MQISQRHGPESRNVAQERNEHLNGLKSATEGLQTGGMKKAEAGLSGSSLNTRINSGYSSPTDQIRNAMNDPKSRQAINTALAEHGAPSFQNRSDWAGSNPELARQVLAAAQGVSSHPSGGVNHVGNSNNRFGAHVDARQTGSNAYGQGASNSAGQIGG